MNFALANQFNDSGYLRGVRSALAPILAQGFHTQRFETAPDPSSEAVAASARADRLLAVVPGSFIFAVSGVSTNAAGFRLQLMDKTTGATLYSSPVRFPSAPIASPEGVTNPLCLLPKPLAVPPPGLISVQITNLATVAASIQAVIHIAQPAAITPEVAAIMNASAAAKRGVSAPIQAATAPQLASLAIDIATAGDNEIISPSAGGTIEILRLVLYNTATQDVILKDGRNTSIFPLVGFGGGAGWTNPGNGDYPELTLTAGNGFYINLSVGSRLTGYCRYRIR